MVDTSHSAQPTVAWARAARTQLERDIRDLLDGFLQETGCPISSLQVSVLEDQRGRAVAHIVEVRVEL